MSHSNHVSATLLAALSFAVAGCSGKTPTNELVSSPQASTSQRVFGKTSAGEDVLLYTLKNAKGMEVDITPWGGTVVSIKVPDRTGKLGDVALGFDTLEGYAGSHPFFGVAVGRYGNRIGRGKFTLDGKQYTLPLNNGEHHLHGGPEGFDKKLWQAREVSSSLGQGIELIYISPDGEQGYPGRVDVTMMYTLTDDNELRIDYLATTDKPTVVNLTNHTYFNLAGEGEVLGHAVQIKATSFTPTDAGLIPTGEIRSVTGTPFDFTTPHAIGERINADDQQLKFGKGYDHNWVLDGTAGELRLVAQVSEPKTGRVLEVLTTEPGLQFYTGNFLDGTVKGKGGTVYLYRTGFCMETQHYPDSPNKANFPSTTLLPGQRYQTTTVYRFSTEK